MIQALLVQLLFSLGSQVLLEQPQNSLMQHHPRFQHLIKWLGEQNYTMKRIMIWMSAFGADSPKPTWLYAYHEAITELSGKPKKETEISTSKPMTRKRLDSMNLFFTHVWFSHNSQMMTKHTHMSPGT